MEIKFNRPLRLRAPKSFTYRQRSSPYSRNTIRSPQVKISSPTKLGRGSPEVPKHYMDKCPCHRDKAIVYCRSCGYHINNSRVALACPVHTRVKFLLDIHTCPRCFSDKFLDEI